MIIQRLFSNKDRNLRIKLYSKEEITKQRTPKSTPKDMRSGFEKTIETAKEKGKKLLENPKTKKWGYIGAGALAGSLAVSGVDAAVKKHKEKKKENEIREKIAGGKK